MSDYTPADLEKAQELLRDSVRALRKGEFIVIGNMPVEGAVATGDPEPIAAALAAEREACETALRKYAARHYGVQTVNELVDAIRARGK